MIQEKQGHLGMGSHQSAAMLKDEWLTPPEIIAALGGHYSFDFDPCSPINRPWPTARVHYTIADNGLTRPWVGRGWFNPPYGGPLIVGPWMRRIADHGIGTALIFARTETALFFETIWQRATAILFLEGRLHFHHVDGSRAKANAGAPSVLVAYGDHDAEILQRCGIAGQFISLRESSARPTKFGAEMIEHEAKEWIATGLVDERDSRAVTSFAQWLMKVAAERQMTHPLIRPEMGSQE